MLISAVQQSDSVICICTCITFSYTYIYIYKLSFEYFFHYDLSLDIEYSSLCCIVGPCSARDMGSVTGRGTKPTYRHCSGVRVPEPESPCTAMEDPVCQNEDPVQPNK